MTVEKLCDSNSCEGAKIILFGRERKIKEVSHIQGNVYEVEVFDGESFDTFSVSAEHEILDKKESLPKTSEPVREEDIDDIAKRIPKAGEVK